MSDHALRAALTEARVLLRAPAARREPVWPALAAAAFFAVSALGFAAAAILAPPVLSTPAHSGTLRGSD
jgi:hypothetical protein